MREWRRRIRRILRDEIAFHFYPIIYRARKEKKGRRDSFFLSEINFDERRRRRRRRRRRKGRWLVVVQ